MLSEPVSPWGELLLHSSLLPWRDPAEEAQPV